MAAPRKVRFFRALLFGLGSGFALSLAHQDRSSLDRKSRRGVHEGYSLGDRVSQRAIHVFVSESLRLYAAPQDLALILAWENEWFNILGLVVTVIAYLAAVSTEVRISILTRSFIIWILLVIMADSERPRALTKVIPAKHEWMKCAVLTLNGFEDLDIHSFYCDRVNDIVPVANPSQGYREKIKAVRKWLLIYDKVIFLDRDLYGVDLTETRKEEPGVYTGKEFQTGVGNATSRATGVIMVINSSRSFDMIDRWAKWLDVQNENMNQFSDETYIQEHPLVSRSMLGLGWVPAKSHCDRAVTNRRSCMRGEREPNEHHMWGGRWLLVILCWGVCQAVGRTVYRKHEEKLKSFVPLRGCIDNYSTMCVVPVAGLCAMFTCNNSRGVSPTFFIALMILHDMVRCWVG
jgi:hypothetical protein